MEMKKKIKWTWWMTTILSLVICYLGIAFVLWDITLIGLSELSSNARAGIAVLVVILSSTSTCIHLLAMSE